MNDNEFLGLLIGALVVLIGFLSAIITPIIKLNKTITVLDQTLKNLNQDFNIQKGRITEHGREIDHLNEETIKQAVILENHEKRIIGLESLHKRKGD